MIFQETLFFFYEIYDTYTAKVARILIFFILATLTYQ